ncbi:MAG: hypothetical protein J2P50_10535 [Hyphomicrobiaceae bacterium]|nr:hypothetical protein [Hyphomicrobiaceae bacterium]
MRSGVCANLTVLESPAGRSVRLLDNMDGNLAWVNTHLIRVEDKLDELRVEMRNITDQLAKQKRG